MLKTGSLLILLCFAVVTATKAQDVGYKCDDVYSDNEDVEVKIVAMLGLQLNKNHVCTNHSFGIWKGALAIKWAASMLNGQHGQPNVKPFIPGVKIGVDIINDCSIISKASFHTGQLMSDYFRNDRCHRNMTSITSAPLVGMIGTSTSLTTTVVSNIIRQYHIPLVGVSATVQELSDKKVYPMFIRAIPSDTQQAQIIVELAKELKWRYIVGIHSDSNYGRLGMQEVTRLAEKEHICIAETVEISEDFLQSKRDMEDLFRDTLFTKLDRTKDEQNQKEEMLGVVYFGEYSYLMTLFRFINSIRKSWTNPDRIGQIHWIFPDAVPPKEALKSYLFSFNTQAYLVGPPTVNMPSYTDYMTNLLSSPPPWMTVQWRESIKQALASSYNCQNFSFTAEDVERCRLGDIDHTSYLNSAIDSVYIMASLVKKAHKSHCGSAEGVCPALQNAIKNGLLTHVSFQEVVYEDISSSYAPQDFVNNKRQLVRINGDLKVTGQSLYSVTQFSSNNGGYFQKIAVADDSNNLVFMDKNRTKDPSECMKNCKECHALNDVPYSFKSGTVIIVGVFALHKTSEADAFQCGEFRKAGLDYMAMEGFINVINSLKQSSGGIDYGYLIIDDCYSPVRVSKLLLDALDNSVRIVDKSTGELFKPENVWAVIGALTSPSTIAMLSHVRDLYIPVISYSATTPSLNDKILYPYFSRTLPSDTLQAQGVVEIIKYMNATHVGVIALDNIYGLELLRLFVEKAEKQRICVEEALIANDYTNMADIDKKLGELKAKKVKVVVLFVGASIATKVLNSPTLENHDFHFVASEALNLSPSILTRGLGERSKGTLIFVPSSPEKFDFEFKDHIQTLNAFDDSASVWLRKFWEGYFHCDLPGSFYNKYKETCPKELRDKDYDIFLTSPKILRTAVATISAGRAIGAYLKSHQHKVERKNIIDQGKGSQLAKNLTLRIRGTKLTSVDGRRINVFDDEGNENAGFDVYNVHRSGKESYKFVHVGEFHNDGVLKINRRLLKFYDKYGSETQFVESSCLRKPDCEKICGDTEMLSTSTEPPIIIKEESRIDMEVVGLIIGCALLLALLIVSIIIIVLIWIGKIRFPRRNGDKYNLSIEANPALPPRPRSGYDSENSPNYDYPISDHRRRSRSADGINGHSLRAGLRINERSLSRNTVVSFSLSDTVVNGSIPSTRIGSYSSIRPESSNSDKADESNETLPFAVSKLAEESNQSFGGGGLAVPDAHIKSCVPIPAKLNSEGTPDVNSVNNTAGFPDVSKSNKGGSESMGQINHPVPRPHVWKTSQFNGDNYQDGDKVVQINSPRQPTVPNNQWQAGQTGFGGFMQPGFPHQDAAVYKESPLKPRTNLAYPLHMLGVGGGYMIPMDPQNQQLMFIVHNTNNNNFNRDLGNSSASPEYHSGSQSAMSGANLRSTGEVIGNVPNNVCNPTESNGISNPGYSPSPDEEIFQPNLMPDMGNQPYFYTVPSDQMAIHNRFKYNLHPNQQSPNSNPTYAVLNTQPPHPQVNQTAPKIQHPNGYLQVIDPYHFEGNDTTNANSASTKIQSGINLQKPNTSLDVNGTHAEVRNKRSVDIHQNQNPNSMTSNALPMLNLPLGDITLPLTPQAAGISQSELCQENQSQNFEALTEINLGNNYGRDESTTGQKPRQSMTVSVSKSSDISEEDNTNTITKSSKDTTTTNNKSIINNNNNNNNNNNSNNIDKNSINTTSPGSTEAMTPSSVSLPSDLTSLGFQPQSKNSIAYENSSSFNSSEPIPESPPGSLKERSLSNPPVKKEKNILDSIGDDLPEDSV